MISACLGGRYNDETEVDHRDQPFLRCERRIDSQLPSINLVLIQVKCLQYVLSSGLPVRTFQEVYDAVSGLVEAAERASVAPQKLP